MASRVIVKNLPLHVTESRLREHFAALGEVTDCRLQKTKAGHSRQFAYIGFRKPAEAGQAIAQLHQTYFDTSKITVETAFEPGSKEIARPWSRYTPGSTLYFRKNKKLVTGKAGVDGQAASRAAPGAQTSQLGAKQDGRKVKAIPLKPPKAGKEDGTAGATTPGGGGPARPAFDEGLDDLAYLRRVASSAAQADSVAGTGEPAAAEGPEDEGAALDELGSTGRLYITNIPYGATEEELRMHFDHLGEIMSISICTDEDTLRPRGFGYVKFAFPEVAVRALSTPGLRSFQGRLLHFAPAHERPDPADAAKDVVGAGGSSYKRKKAEKQKKVDAHLEHTWNLLYMSANAASDAAAGQLGMQKSDLLGKDSENAAVTAALTETSIIQQTKRWLQKEGIRVDAFEQSGTSLTNSKPIDSADKARREDTLIVKHLPAGANIKELRERFARYGELVRCTLAPSGTVGLAQYVDKSQAKLAFKKLAFSRYQHVPLYLEWAPGDVFDGEGGAGAGEAEGGAEDRGTGVEEAAGAGEAEDQGDEDEDEEARGCLFVKNLSFATSDDALKAAFSGCRGFRSALVMKKVAAVKTKSESAREEKSLSMGYGFLEFNTSANAVEAIKKKQGLMLDGHAVQLAVSHRRAKLDDQTGKTQQQKKTKKTALSTQRLCVRNLAFEATAKELRQLFGAYGSLTAVRLPKKADYTGHRGFAFLDFASKSEAAAAFEALQHTHFYGRRLVIEPSEQKQSDVGAAQQLAEKKQTAKELRSEAKRRRTAGVFNAPKDEKSFEDALVG